MPRSRRSASPSELSGTSGPASPHFDHARHPYERDTTRGAPAGAFETMHADTPRLSLQPIACGMCGGVFGFVNAEKPQEGLCPAHARLFGRIADRALKLDALAISALKAQARKMAAKTTMPDRKRAIDAILRRLTKGINDAR